PMNFPAGYGFTFDGGDYGNDDEAMQQMVFNLLIALVMILRGDGGGVRVAAVPGGNHEWRAVLDLRRVLAVLDHRHLVRD
ncbi:hypothetical protein, partial [Bacillus cereus]|uniref:hypothetical protein n=1 Tax=Bacillus cereus TaxID=1396 RepID=UPI000534DF53